MATMAALLTLFWISFHYWPDLPGGFQNYFSSYRLAGIAKASESIQVQPVVWLFFVHASYCLLASVWSRGIGKSKRACLRASIAAILLVWLTYYVHRPLHWNITGSFFLYGFLLIDLLEIIFSRRWKLPSIEHPLIGSIACLTLILPLSCWLYAREWPRFSTASTVMVKRQADKSNCVLLSGVLVGRDLALELQDKAAFLKRQHAKGPVAYITLHPVLMRKLAGCSSATNLSCPSFNIKSETAMSELSDELYQNDHRQVLIDAPGKEHANLHYDKFLLSMEKHLERNYHKIGTNSSWNIWSANSASAARRECGELPSNCR